MKYGVFLGKCTGNMRKLWIFSWNMGFPVICPLNQSIERVMWSCLEVVYNPYITSKIPNIPYIIHLLHGMHPPVRSHLNWRYLPMFGLRSKFQSIYLQNMAFCGTWYSTSSLGSWRSPIDWRKVMWSCLERTEQQSWDIWPWLMSWFFQWLFKMAKL